MTGVVLINHLSISLVTPEISRRNLWKWRHWWMLTANIQFFVFLGLLSDGLISFRHILMWFQTSSHISLSVDVTLSSTLFMYVLFRLGFYLFFLVDALFMDQLFLLIDLFLVPYWLFYFSSIFYSPSQTQCTSSLTPSLLSVLTLKHWFKEARFTYAFWDFGHTCAEKEVQTSVED